MGYDGIGGPRKGCWERETHSFWRVWPLVDFPGFLEESHNHIQMDSPDGFSG